MKRFLTQSGWVAYEATAEEIQVLGGVGICDHCSHRSDRGYLVPVLNHWVCPPCFDSWATQTKFYPEDLPTERRNMERYERLIPLDADN